MVRVMKAPKSNTLLLVLPLAATSFLASCVSDNYQSAGYNQPPQMGYTTYEALPRNYSGDAYYHNNRYYVGGRYEPGAYSYKGRTYDHRYIHNGQYLYGGEYRPQLTRASYQEPVGSSPSSVRYVTYRTLPADYSGDIYYHNDRYYAGGVYEPGTYSYKGRTYNHRYIHDGQYLYGGEYRPSVSTVTTQRTTRRSSPTYRTITR
jgi:hypothetical protein